MCLQGYIGTFNGVLQGLLQLSHLNPKPEILINILGSRVWGLGFFSLGRNSGRKKGLRV